MLIFVDPLISYADFGNSDVDPSSAMLIFVVPLISYADYLISYAESLLYPSSAMLITSSAMLILVIEHHRFFLTLSNGSRVTIFSGFQEKNSGFQEKFSGFQNFQDSGKFQEVLYLNPADPEPSRHLPDVFNMRMVNYTT